MVLVVEAPPFAGLGGFQCWARGPQGFSIVPCDITGFWAVWCVCALFKVQG